MREAYNNKNYLFNHFDIINGALVGKLPKIDYKTRISMARSFGQEHHKIAVYITLVRSILEEKGILEAPTNHS